MIIRSLRVNHIENPLGYKMDKPFLSWTGGIRNRQKANRRACGNQPFRNI